jgi:dihydroorotate dehydrogenase (NAD+) catalytic subunit
MTDAGSAVDLSVSIGAGRKGDPLQLANPIIAASGTFGTGLELQRDIDLTAIGAFVTPAITRRAHGRRPAVPPRESPAGLFLAGPYPSIGLRAVLNRFASLWEGWPVPVIANIPAGDADECFEVAAALAGYAGVAAIELSFVSDAAWLDDDDNLPEFGRICRRLSDTWPRPLIVKLPYGLTDTIILVDAAGDAGVDAVSLGGGFPARIVDRDVVADRARFVTGRVTGPATHPMALHVTAAVCAGTKMPVIASGGVSSGDEALGFLQAGARAVQVGSASLRDPAAVVRVARDLEWLVRGAGRSSDSD